MNEAASKVAEQTEAQAGRLSLQKVLEVCVESAVDALAKAFLVVVFGGIAVGIAGEIWRQMAVSRPPGLVLKAEAETSAWLNVKGWELERSLPIIFGIVFVPTLWGRLARAKRLPKAKHQKASGVLWLGRVTKEISENWFGLFVGNAFGAMISAMVVGFVSQFEPTRMLIEWVLGMVLPVVYGGLNLLFGKSAGEMAEAWFNWFGQNELKFTFWFFYVTAICDDLGIPNLKTLGRRFMGWWRRAEKKEKNGERGESGQVGAKRERKSGGCDRVDRSESGRV